MFKANEERTNTPHNYLNICLGGRKKVSSLRTNETGPVAALFWRTRNPPSWQTLDKPLCVCFVLARSPGQCSRFHGSLKMELLTHSRQQKSMPSATVLALAFDQSRHVTYLYLMAD